MNDKCVVGIGWFLEIIFNFLGSDIESIDILVKGYELVNIFSMCIVFVEFEIVSFLV